MDIKIQRLRLKILNKRVPIKNISSNLRVSTLDIKIQESRLKILNTKVLIIILFESFIKKII